MKDETVVHRVDEFFTEEALAANDGKVLPLRDKPGGRIIGEATLKYDPDKKALTGEFRIDDPKLAEFLKGPMPNIFE